MFEREKKTMHKLPVMFTICFHPSLAQHARTKQQINKCLSRQNLLCSVAAVMSSKWRKTNIMDEMKWNAERSQINVSLKQNCCGWQQRVGGSALQNHVFLFRETETLQRLLCHRRQRATWRAVDQYWEESQAVFWQWCHRADYNVFPGEMACSEWNQVRQVWDCTTPSVRGN